MDEWVAIEGYRWPYRINRKGCVQKKMEDGSWYTLKPYTSGRSRVAVKLRSTDNRKIDVPVVWLMADAFMGGTAAWIRYRPPKRGQVRLRTGKPEVRPARRVWTNLLQIPPAGGRES